MTTTPAPAAPRSRLDPEPIARRDFLGLLAGWSAAFSLLFAVIGMARLPRAAVLPSPSRKFRVTLPDALAPGEAFVPPGRNVAVYRDGGGIYAISLTCTHLGCIVKTAADGFLCPCHGSKYAPDGAVTRGPAPKSLPWFAVTAAGGGSVFVDEGTVVPAGTKVEA
jgi:nitrite reductase/ring-hydroxylating ferredoxin subunit